MRKKKTEDKISQEFEASLPSSGLAFETLSSSVDFSKYEKPKKPFFRRPWFLTVSGGALSAVVAVTITMAVLKSQQYRETGHAFIEGTYSFAKIIREQGNSDLPKPTGGDSLVIGEEPVGESYFSLTNESASYDGYLSIVGTASSYGLSATRVDVGQVYANFLYKSTAYEAIITAMKYTPIIYLEIKSDSYSCSASFTKL